MNLIHRFTLYFMDMPFRQPVMIQDLDEVAHLCHWIGIYTACVLVRNNLIVSIKNQKSEQIGELIWIYTGYPCDKVSME